MPITVQEGDIFMVENEAHLDPAAISMETVTVKDAIALLFSFAQAINPKLGPFMMDVAQLSTKVGKVLQLDAVQVYQLETAAMIHDIGLVTLPMELQNKDVNVLTELQFRQYSQHPVVAATALESLESLADIGEMVLFHHEYMNGKGFPNGLSGETIPIGARILLVVSDYLQVKSTWPRKMRQLVNYARRYLGADEWKTIPFSDDPETIIEAAAQKLLMMEINEKYDGQVVNALIQILQKEKNVNPADLVRLGKLKSGMLLMEDLHLEGGRLLLTKGTALNGSVVQTLQSFGDRKLIPDKIYVQMPES